MPRIPAPALFDLPVEVSGIPTWKTENHREEGVSRRNPGFCRTSPTSLCTESWKAFTIWSVNEHTPQPGVEPSPAPRRYAIVGTGSRARMYTRALVTTHADRGRLVALCDPNRTRMAVHNEIVTQAGYDPVPTYHPDDFTRMLDAEAVDEVIVCTVDRLHADYIVAALDAGRDVITEKPMTADLEGCRRIYAAQERTGGRVTVGFNYRYNPVHRQLHTLLRSGVIGEIGSVHFEWLLDLRHGADYFRRWHRDKHNSGGLLVHKASHHFDLVNWWIGSRPTEVFAWGDLFFYGPENGRRHGVAADYERAHNSPAAENDPFALHLRDSADLTKLYLDAEHEDGYRRDLNVFGPGITIEDDMSVLVRYASGVKLTYHLVAYAPGRATDSRSPAAGAASSLTSPNPRGPRRTRTRPHRYGACPPPRRTPLPP